MLERTFLFAVLAVASCGGSNEPAAQPSSGSSASAPSSSGAPSASSSAVSANTSSTIAPSSSASAPPSKTGERSKGPFHFTTYKGPVVKTAVDTPKVWAVVPVGLEGYEKSTLKFMLVDYVKSTGNEHETKRFDGAVYDVPQALVFPAKAAGALKKGDSVMVDEAAASCWGRVTSVDSDSVHYQYEFGGSVSEGDSSPDRVIKLTDTVTYGHRWPGRKEIRGTPENMRAATRTLPS
jgi:hypothetical protein